MPEVAGLTLGVPRETYPGETRVALIPDALGPLLKAGLAIIVEQDAGAAAGFRDSAYQAKGARSVSRAELVREAGLLVHVRGPQADAGLRRGQTLIAMLDPLSEPGSCAALARAGVDAFALELIPRITRAQSMDVLSSMATIAGYKAVLLAASMLPRMFPLLMTAAGTLAPARVLVIGVGVAGLQAIATARRLGAVVSAYDIRPAVKEQVQSLGARFVELPLETEQAEAKGGYAKAMDEEFYRRQRELMSAAVADSDVVISTAAVPGKKAPVLVTGEMVRRMTPGSLIVDLAAERGGNCELTRPGETVVESGVTIAGVMNLATTIPYHASQMYAKNIQTFLLHLVKDGRLVLDLEDEITAATMVTRGGEVVHPQVRELLNPKQGS